MIDKKYGSYISHFAAMPPGILKGVNAPTYYNVYFSTKEECFIAHCDNDFTIKRKTYSGIKRAIKSDYDKLLEWHKKGNKKAVINTR